MRLVFKVKNTKTLNLRANSLIGRIGMGIGVFQTWANDDGTELGGLLNLIHKRIRKFAVSYSAAVDRKAWRSAAP